MATNKQLLLSALLRNVEVEGDIGKRGKRSQYSVRCYVDDKKVITSSNKPASSALSWEWNTNDQIWFTPSSMMRIMVYRGFGTAVDWKDLVGLYQAKVVGLLENSNALDLTDEKGIAIAIPIKLKIALFPIPESNDYIEQFMERVDADISLLLRNGAVTSTASTLGQVLNLTKSVMDQVSRAHPILNASWTIVSSLYKAVQDTDLQDESIRELASTLREMLGTAKAIPNLTTIPDTTDVIEAISRQSLEVASLIHEYTKLVFAKRTVKLQVSGNLKPRISECQKRCAALKDDFYGRVHFDTNTEVKNMVFGVQQIGQTLEVIKDNKLAGKISSWLSPPDSSRNYNEAAKKRQRDTCTWFLDGKRFLDWIEKPGFLWVKGKAGSGKSILCSSVIEFSQKNAPFGSAYFFFDGRDSQKALQLHENLIRSLISQFSHQRGGIPAELADLYKSCGDHQQPSVNQLQDVLRNILVGFSSTYIVIDALDECTDREETLVWLNNLVSNTNWAAGNFHIMVTSRPERDIEEVFGMFDPHGIDVGEATANKDIIKYLESQMESILKKYDVNFQEEIKSSLREHADGSFRWVSLQLAELEKCLSEYEIRKKMKNLPKGLDEIYERMLKAIDEEFRADTMTFLEWLSFSKRPMKVAEIAEAITVNFNSKDGPVFDATKRYSNPRDMLVRCSSLATESDGTVKLSHFSVKEYLLSERVEDNFRISEKAAHSKITEISVAYLLQFDSFEPLTEDVLNNSPLARYAAKYWIDHAKSGEMDSRLLKLVLRLFTTETAPLTNWIQLWNIDGNTWRQGEHLMTDRAEVCSPVYYATLAGIEKVLYTLLEKGANVNVQGGYYGSALQAASYKGHQAIVKALLEKGVDLNAQGGEYGSALQAASYSGHEAIVKALLENRADVNTQGGFYGSALQIASSEGHDVIVNVLLEKGADVNAQGGKYRSALLAASYEGHMAIVKVLLQKGADVNAQGGTYGSALQAASSKGHEAIVDVLLKKGADVNAQGGQYGSALKAASYGGHEAIVKVLLRNGADVNAQRSEYGSALQVASYGRYKAIVNVLLEWGADVNAQGGYYGFALQAASCDYKKVIAKVLLENTADGNPQRRIYEYRHYTASSAGQQASEVIVNVLLEKGADVNAQGGEHGSALQAASYSGYEVVVKVLLKKGADVNAQGGYYGSALQAASYKGHEAIVKVLLEKGADVNAQGGKYGSALQAASSEGHEAIVKVLLEKGADVNAQGEYESALEAASYRGHEAVVKVLLENGADVSAVDVSQVWYPGVRELLMNAERSQESSSAVEAI